MKTRLVIAVTMLGLLLIPACSVQQPDSDPEVGGGGPSNKVRTTAAPAPDAGLEWDLIACAIIDSNNNGEVDIEDGHLRGGQLQVDLADGVGFGGITGKDGCAEIMLPGAPGDEAGVYPITMQMLAPAGRGYRHVWPEVVTLVYPETSAAFLFVTGK